MKVIFVLYYVMKYLNDTFKIAKTEKDYSYN